MDGKSMASTTKHETGVWRLHEDTPLGARMRSLFGGANNSEIARLLGVHNSTIHTIAVTGKISQVMLDKIVAHTGCDPDWLRYGDDHFLISEAVN